MKKYFSELTNIIHFFDENIYLFNKFITIYIFLQKKPKNIVSSGLYL